MFKGVAALSTRVCQVVALSSLVVNVAVEEREREIPLKPDPRRLASDPQGERDDPRRLASDPQGERERGRERERPP